MCVPTFLVMSFPLSQHILSPSVISNPTVIVNTYNNIMLLQMHITVGNHDQPSNSDFIFITKILITKMIMYLIHYQNIHYADYNHPDNYVYLNQII
eukprot:132766_1